MDHSVSLRVDIEAIAWATPRPGLSLDELADVLRGLGNEVLEIDRAGNRIKVLHVRREGT